MNRAYHCPFNVEPGPLACTLVDLAGDHDMLDQAARNRRLLCPYCLKPVTLVHRAVGRPELRCFAHLPATPAPLCPYRTYGEPDGSPGIRSPEHNLRKKIENVLQIELQRNLGNRYPDVRIERSDYGAPEPCLRITGLESLLQVRGLAPGCEALWSQPFDGSLDGAEVLFFVVGQDAPRLDQPFIDRHLLARRPAIVVADAGDGAEHTYAMVSSLADHPAGQLIATLDLLRVDYARLFGLDRPPEYLFLPVPCRQTIEEIARRLSASGLAPEEAKMLRLLAKRTLVDGAAAHASVFGQPQAEAGRFFVATRTFPCEKDLPDTREMGRLLENRKLHRFCDERPLLAPLWESFFSDAFAALGGTIRSLRTQAEEGRDRLAAAAAERAALDERLAAQRKALATDREAAAAERKKAELEQRELTAEIEGLRRELAKEQKREENLAHALGEVDSHLLGHWVLTRYAPPDWQAEPTSPALPPR